MVTEHCPNDISSTRVRRAIKRKESVRFLLPDNVIDYIKKEKLYQEDTSETDEHDENKPCSLDPNGINEK